jgi:hypothetical protein
VKNPKENSEKMKIVNFLHFLFTLVQNPTKTPITGNCDRGCVYRSRQMMRQAVPIRRQCPSWRQPGKRQI